MGRSLGSLTGGYAFLFKHNIAMKYRKSIVVVIMIWLKNDMFAVWLIRKEKINT